MEFIYIPLCLYLYLPAAVGYIAIRKFTFHYVYIYILLRYPYCFYFLIYIPLCLYLYNRTWPDWTYRTIIYIPLCLYLYPVRNYLLFHLMHLHSTMFTFISCNCRVISARIIWFTFHYVYIYIPWCLLSPIMASWFTFHYVYIYIWISEFINIPVISFTFHYVYIYITQSKTTRNRKTNIYIPLCLYLYGIIAFLSLCLIDLHSTMFIFIWID